MATDLGLNFAPQVGTEVTAPWSEPGDIVAGPTTRGTARSGYTLWTFDGSAWTMTKDRSAEGYRAASAPTVSGRFKGQVRAILSVPVAELA